MIKFLKKTKSPSAEALKFREDFAFESPAGASLTDEMLNKVAQAGGLIPPPPPRISAVYAEREPWGEVKDNVCLCFTNTDGSLEQ